METPADQFVDDLVHGNFDILNSASQSGVSQTGTCLQALHSGPHNMSQETGKSSMCPRLSLVSSHFQKMRLSCV